MKRSESNVLEQEYQQLVRLEVTRTLGASVRAWRQPAGRLETKRGGWVECAPVGAADLTGIVAPTGVRLEVELKGPRTPTTEQQILWRESMAARGAVALLLRYDPAVSMEGNVVLACAELGRAVAAAACMHPDETLVLHRDGGVACTRCGWRNGGRAREVIG